MQISVQRSASCGISNEYPLCNLCSKRRSQQFRRRATDGACGGFYCSLNCFIAVYCSQLFPWCRELYTECREVFFVSDEGNNERR